MPDRPRVFDPESRTTELLGRRRPSFRTSTMCQAAPWWDDLAVIAGLFLAVNVVFAGDGRTRIDLRRFHDVEPDRTVSPQ